ncbi:MAG: RpiB/LacA/LacB family sugar-phosphate isomerase [Pseudomonadota bacterium]
MRIAVAGDSAGEGLAGVLADHLSARDDLTVDEVSHTSDGPDPFYADLAERVARGILDGRWDRAILICGTGIGVAMSANKIPGIRAAQAHDTYSAERAILSNNAQILTMGARVVGQELAKSIAASFLAHRFDHDGRSAGNVRAVDRLDVKYSVGRWHDAVSTKGYVGS